MAGKLKVKAAGKDVGELSIRRPSYENTAREYKVIYHPSQADEPPLTSSYFAYFYIGGEELREHNRSPNTYANACALRVSFSLNMAGMHIPEVVPVLPVTKLRGKRILRGGVEYIPDGDKYYYIYSVENLNSFLEYAWGKAER